MIFTKQSYKTSSSGRSLVSSLVPLSLPLNNAFRSSTRSGDPPTTSVSPNKRPSPQPSPDPITANIDKLVDINSHQQLTLNLLMDDLPPHWNDIDKITDLAEATQIEIDTLILVFLQSKPKEHPKPARITQHNRSTILPSAPATTSELPPEADDSCRYPMPTTFPTSKDFCTHIRVESRAGKTQAKLKIKYATPDTHGCWLCRFQQGDKAFHTDSECNLLKILYPYLSSPNVYLSVPTLASQYQLISSNRKTLPSDITNPSSNTINMCYDTGTFPSMLCDQLSLFSTITPFKLPKFISLGDDTMLIPALGEGILDYVINDKYRIQEEAILKSCTPVALKSVPSHTISRKENAITITYPTFLSHSHVIRSLRIPHYPR